MRRWVLTGVRATVACAAVLAGMAGASAGAADGRTAPPALYVLGGPAAVSDTVVGDVERALGTRARRLSGPDRYATAVAVSRAHVMHAGTVLMASGENFPDALTAAPVAARLGAPLLLAGRDGLPETTRAELDRLRPERVLIAGGPAAVSPAVAAQLAASGARVERVFGPDRYATSAALAAVTAPGRAPLVLVASGRDFPDALSAAPPAAVRHAPLLLVDPDGASPSVRAALARLRPEELVIVGGPGAVPPPVEQALRAETGAAIRRIAGADRFATNARIAEAFYPDGVDAVYVATPWRYPDAMVMGAVAPRQAVAGGATPARHTGWEGMLLYAADPGLSPAVREHLRRVGDASSPSPSPSPSPTPSPSASPSPAPAGGGGGGGGAGGGAPANSAPTVDLNGADPGTGASSAFTEDQPEVLIAPAAVLSDSDGATLHGLTVTLTATPDGAAERLLMTGAPPGGITAVYDPATATLTLSGEGSVDDYEQALRLVAYVNSDQAPDTTAREVTITTTDGSASSAPATASIAVSAVNDAPLPLDDAYGDEPAFGNVLFVSGADDGGPAAAAKTSHSLRLLDNDADPDGDALTVTALVVTTGPGTATLLDAQTGAFAYEPRAPGAHVLTYTVDDGRGAADSTATATVTIDVEQRVWFVDNAGPAGDGRSTTPAADLATVVAAAAPGDILFLFEGATRGGSPLAGPLTLQAGQQLLGQPAGLTLTHSEGGTATAVAASGGKPVLANPGGTALTLASGTTVRHVEIGAAALGIAGTAAADVATLRDVAVTGATAGVALSGGTYALTGGVAITSATGDALEQTSGTLTVSGSGNTLGAAGGAALDVTGTTVSGGLAFQSIDADGGANAITFTPLNGATATLSVNGTGGAGSGGTIRNTTGDAVIVNGGNLELLHMLLRDSAARAIRATGATGFSLNSVALRGNGGAGAAPTVELIDVIGPIALLWSTFAEGTGDLLRLANTDTNASVTVGGSTFDDTTGTGAGIDVTADGTSAVNLAVTGSIFRDLAGPAVAWTGGVTAGSTGASSLSFHGNTAANTLAGRHSGLHVIVGAATATTVTVGGTNPGQANAFADPGGTAAIDVQAQGSAVLRATVRATTIDRAIGAGIRVATSEAASGRVLVDGNVIRDAVKEAIWLSDGGGAGTETLDVTVTGNTVSGAAGDGAAVSALRVGAVEHGVCADVQSNAVSATAGGKPDIALETQGTGVVTYVMAGAGPVTDADVIARNTIDTASVDAGITRSGGSGCQLP